MIKIKELLIMPTILVILGTFFCGIGFAAKVMSINKEKGDVFVGDPEVYGLIMGTGKCFFLPSGTQIVDSIVQEVSASEFVIEKNRKLVGWERKKRKSIEQIYRENAARQKIIQEDYMRRMQEQERIKEEEQDEEIIRKQEMERERERIKKEDPFR